jgi:hypothetical protein
MCLTQLTSGNCLFPEWDQDPCGWKPKHSFCVCPNITFWSQGSHSKTTPYNSRVTRSNKIRLTPLCHPSSFISKHKLGIGDKAHKTSSKRIVGKYRMIFQSRNQTNNKVPLENIACQLCLQTIWKLLISFLWTSLCKYLQIWQIIGPRNINIRMLLVNFLMVKIYLLSKESKYLREKPLNAP